MIPQSLLFGFGAVGKLIDVGLIGMAGDWGSGRLNWANFPSQEFHAIVPLEPDEALK